MLNPDVSANGEHHAAPPGSVLVFYATGEGIHNEEKPLLPLELRIGGEAAEILWAAAAPGCAASATLRAGTAVSPPVTVWIE